MKKATKKAAKTNVKSNITLEQAIETILSFKTPMETEIENLKKQVQTLTTANNKLKAEKEAYLKKNPMSKLEPANKKPETKKVVVEATPKREEYLKANPASKFTTKQPSKRKVANKVEKKTRK